MFTYGLDVHIVNTEYTRNSSPHTGAAPHPIHSYVNALQSEAQPQLQAIDVHIRMSLDYRENPLRIASHSQRYYYIGVCVCEGVCLYWN